MSLPCTARPHVCCNTLHHHLPSNAPTRTLSHTHYTHTHDCNNFRDTKHSSTAAAAAPATSATLTRGKGFSRRATVESAARACSRLPSPLRLDSRAELEQVKWGEGVRCGACVRACHKPVRRPGHTRKIHQRLAQRQLPGSTALSLQPVP